MIEFFEKERVRVSYETTTQLIEEVNKLSFKSEEDMLDWAETVEEAYGTTITLNDYLFLLDVAFDRVQE